MDTTIGRVGLWTMDLDAEPAARVRELAAEVEELGFGALWIGERFGRNPLTHAALLLGATERLVVATGIANIYLRHPIAMAAAERSLAEAYPSRFVLGLGGQPFDARTRSMGKGVSAMSEYLDSMDAAPLQNPISTGPTCRVLGAIGPRMVELAGKKTDGALPYLVPVAHTEKARAQLGPDALLAVEQAVVLEQNTEAARDISHAHVAMYLAVSESLRKNMLALGYKPGEVTSHPSDRVVDALVAGGGPRALDDISARVRAHLDAGADHVCLQVLTTGPTAAPIAQWRLLAELDHLNRR
ncbi:putative F420-dependent oxidoreductase, MSMEG_4141 family [Nocardia amikacinitolerans]|uniref:TIGR03620 family F420-dependent LLM class oxidoreductase n=1 Tax=Nocardia amikacinitolerans TaxID=756689 RepID=UPI0009FD927B|nr:TIGR03620 family F420-dependent LLM class oxidoreductase [Nocardia amikacinitolerans]MCP2321470.1 putative F420-dependent oxidoreductase, MSMEG_4141 family [Nocardia amikacinitolerans]